MNTFEKFQNVKIFYNLNFRDLFRVEEYIIEESFSKGRFIFRQEEPPDYLYIVMKGLIKLIKDTLNGSSTIIEILSSGEQLNASFILENKPYAYSAIALTEGYLIKIPASKFLLLVKELSNINRNIMIDISEKMRKLIENISSFATSKVEGRLCRMLANLARRYGINGDCRGIILDIALTRQDIADFIGTTLETAIRTLNKIRDDGLINWEGKRFFIPDLNSLENVSSKN